MKPNVTESMMLLLENETTEPERHILPLSDIEISQKRDKGFIKIMAKCNFKSCKYKTVSIGLTNDPRNNHPKDWTDLGCFRVMIEAYNVTIKSKGYILIETNNFILEKIQLADRI